MDQRIVDYIKKSRELGHNDSDIKALLLNAGHKEEDVRAAFDAADGKSGLQDKSFISSHPSQPIVPNFEAGKKKVLVVLVIIVSILIFAGIVFYFFTRFQQLQNLSIQQEERITQQAAQSELEKSNLQKQISEQDAKQEERITQQAAQSELEKSNLQKQISEQDDRYNSYLAYLDRDDQTRLLDIGVLEGLLDYYFDYHKEYDTQFGIKGCENPGRIYSSVEWPLTNVDGSGWLPIDFSVTSLTGYTILELPIDPVNTSTNFYLFACDSSNQYELNTVLESPQYKPKAKSDGGNNSNVYEVGTNLNLIK